MSHISPHTKHHESLHAVEILDEALERTNFSDDAKSTVVTTFLRLLQEDDSDWRASRYAKSMREMVWDRMNDADPVEAKDLPSPLVKEP